MLIGTVLWEEKEKVEVMRLKGFVKITGNNHMFSLQGYHLLYSCSRVNETFELVETDISNTNQ